MLYKESVGNKNVSVYKNHCMIISMMWNSSEDIVGISENMFGICQLTDVLEIC